MKEPTDTEMLDWLIANFLETQSDAATYRIAGAMMLGKTGRDLIRAAMAAE